MHFDTAVHFAAFGGAVVIHRAAGTHTDSLDAILLDARLGEHLHHFLSAVFGKLLVGLFLTHVVGVTLDHNLQILVAIFFDELLSHVLENLLGVGFQGSLAALEGHAIELFDSLLRAAMAVVTRFIRAAVDTGTNAFEFLLELLGCNPFRADAVLIRVRIVFNRATLVPFRTGFKFATVVAAAHILELIKHLLLGDPRRAEGVAIRVRAFHRAALSKCFTGFGRALVNTRADTVILFKHILFGHPRIAEAILVGVRIAKRATFVRSRAKFGRALIDTLTRLVDEPFLSHCFVFSSLFEVEAHLLFSHPRVAEAVVIGIRIIPGATLVGSRTGFTRAHIVTLTDVSEFIHCTFVSYPRRAETITIRVRLLGRTTVECRRTCLARAIIDAFANTSKLLEHLLLGHPRIANTILVSIRFVKRATIVAFASFVRALVNAFADFAEFRFESLFGNPGIANAVFVSIRITQRATLIQTVTDIVGALVFIIRNAIAVAVLSQEEAAPGDTAVNGVLRIHANAFHHGTTRTFTRFKSRSGNEIVATQVIRSTHMQVDTHRQVEHQGTGQLLHVKRTIAILGTKLRSIKRINCTGFEIIQLNIPVVFHEDGHEVHEVDFGSSAHERERHIVTVHAVAVTAIQVQEERESVTTIELACIHRNSKATLNRSALGTERKGSSIGLVDIFGFTNPEALFFGIGCTHCNTAKHGNIEHLVFGQRETSLQVNLEVSYIADLRIRNSRRISRRPHRFLVYIIAFSGKLVIVDRECHTQIKIVPNTDSKTNISASANKIRHRGVSQQRGSIFI